ncbi:MAG TPA: efflux transporter outer membrane subunit [Nitrospiria bacterium]|nr:efflux transporter outer membrane subunit [Nitrospiria bacterium]
MKRNEGLRKACRAAGAPAAKTRRKVGRICLCTVGLLSAMGCALGPDFVRPKPPPVDRYTHGTEPTASISADGQAQHFEPGGKMPGDWWRFLNSTKLDALINQAVTENPDLHAAQARLRQSQNNLLAGYGVFYPEVDGNLGAERQKFSPARIGSSAPASLFNLYTLSATVGYSLDVFGGNRRAVESLEAQVDFQRDAVLATYLSLSGNIVNTVIALAAYTTQIKATEEIIGLLKEQVRITEVQAQAGTVPYLNVLSLRTQLAATEATLPPLEQRRSEAEHLLATLVGRVPAEWDPIQIELADLTLPGDLPITLPSELVHQRPDILAAEALLHSASADIGVATAALFPSFTLNGSYGLNNTSAPDLFKSTSGFWSLGANLTAPLFHGWTLWFERKAAMEAYQQSLANYRQSVLSAFAQVADTLRALEHDAEAVQAQAQALDASEHALRLVQANYQAGVASYLQILVANDQYHQAKIGYLQAHAQRLQDTVALFVALGGGWSDADKEAPGAPSGLVHGIRSGSRTPD